MSRAIIVSVDLTSPLSESVSTTKELNALQAGDEAIIRLTGSPDNETFNHWLAVLPVLTRKEVHITVVAHGTVTMPLIAICSQARGVFTDFFIKLDVTHRLEGNERSVMRELVRRRCDKALRDDDITPEWGDMAVSAEAWLARRQESGAQSLAA